MKNKFKRLLSGVLSAAITITAITFVSAHAEESSELYLYTLYAASESDGAITLSAGNFCVNGSIATKGTISSSGNINVNGVLTENSDESMIFIFDKIDQRYFLSSNVEEHDDDFTLDELNININIPTEVNGETTLTGNVNINSALKSLENINLYGEVKNTNDSAIISKYGDIIIDSQNVNLNGLIYVPFGTVNITAQNLNLNDVVIISNSIVLNCPNINANNSCSLYAYIPIANVTSTAWSMLAGYDNWLNDGDEIAYGSTPNAAAMLDWYLLGMGAECELSSDMVASLIFSQERNVEHYLRNLDACIVEAEYYVNEKNRNGMLECKSDAIFDEDQENYGMYVSCFVNRGGNCPYSHEGQVSLASKYACDWNLAIGESFGTMQANVHYMGNNNYTMNYTYYVYDVYEWPDIDFLRELHLCGWAHQYERPERQTN